MKKPTLPEFGNKVIQVSLVGDDHGFAMASPHFVKQGERLFLVGVVPPGGTSSNWSEGAVVAVVWDRVTDYMVFESVEIYQRGREKYRRHAKRKG
jgi:hypothetical protein